MEFRRVERKEGESFVEIAFGQLMTGDQFRLYDQPGGTVYEDGSKTYRALSDAAPTEPEGNFMVHSEEVPA